MPEEFHYITEPSPEPYHIKIERGQKGGYGWEIGVKGNDWHVMIEQIKLIDLNLKGEFAQGETK